MDESLATVFLTPVSDDVGAETADRYEWQAAMAAADGLALHLKALTNDSEANRVPEVFIACELHEDWVVFYDNQVEMVSAKHREISLGPWKTVNQLVSDGGLGHLFSKWLMMRGIPAIRMVTSADLSGPGLTELKNLVESPRQGKIKNASLKGRIPPSSDLIAEFARAFSKYGKGLPERWMIKGRAILPTEPIGQELLEEVGRFLTGLTIHCVGFSRDVTPDIAPSRYVRPVLEKMGLKHADNDAVWEAVLSLFRARMRSRGTTRRGGLPPILKDFDVNTSLRDYIVETFESRIITLENIESTIAIAVKHSAGFMPLPNPWYITRLSTKMDHGGCSDTSIARAEQLRKLYRKYWRERRDNVLGSQSEFREIDQNLHRLADESTESVRGSETQWGSAMWASLSDAVKTKSPRLVVADSSGDLALGGICDLVSKCKVWFGPRFDVDGTIAKAIANRRSAK